MGLETKLDSVHLAYSVFRDFLSLFGNRSNGGCHCHCRVDGHSDSGCQALERLLDWELERTPATCPVCSDWPAELVLGLLLLVVIGTLVGALGGYAVGKTRSRRRPEPVQVSEGGVVVERDTATVATPITPSLLKKIRDGSATRHP